MASGRMRITCAKRKLEQACLGVHVRMLITVTVLCVQAQKLAALLNVKSEACQVFSSFKFKTLK
jgi:hypothetical protein